MTTEKLGDSSWRHVALLLFLAVDSVRRVGDAIILKWDGSRENGRIYTLVWEGVEDNPPRFRSDGDDLGLMLSQLFSSDECSAPELVPQVAASLATLDSAARKSLVVSLRMIKSLNGVNSQVIILAPGGNAVLFNQSCENVEDLLHMAASFIDGMGISPN